MGIKISYLLIGVFGLIQLAGFQLILDSRQPIDKMSAVAPGVDVSVADNAGKLATLYSKTLRFNVYSFNITSVDTGRVRDVIVKAYRGELLLTNFRVRTDGAIVGAEVADLDNNRFPELYVYSTSDGSGSFGRVYAWQFLPERKADIVVQNWQMAPVQGYMGHDSLWVERDILCRKYPVYQFGDANAAPSGGYHMMRYRLKPTGTGFTLVAE